MIATRPVVGSRKTVKKKGVGTLHRSPNLSQSPGKSSSPVTGVTYQPQVVPVLLVDMYSHAASEARPCIR